MWTELQEEYREIPSKNTDFKFSFNCFQCDWTNTMLNNLGSDSSVNCLTANNIIFTNGCRWENEKK